MSRLRVVPATFIENVYAKPLRPLESNRALSVRCYLNGPVTGGATLTAELRDGARVLKIRQRPKFPPAASIYDLTLESLGSIELWDLKNPKLYTVAVQPDQRRRLDRRIHDPHRAFAKRSSRPPASA